MIRKNTLARRRYVNQTGRIIVPQESDAPASAVRRVTLSLPEEPSVVLAIGPNSEKLEGDLPQDAVEANPKAIAEGRAFMWAPFDGGQPFTIELLAGQWIAVAATEGEAVIGVIIEYLG